MVGPANVPSNGPRLAAGADTSIASRSHSDSSYDDEAPVGADKANDIDQVISTEEANRRAKLAALEMLEDSSPAPSTGKTMH